MSILIGSAISAGASIIGGIIGGGKARRAKRRAARKLKKNEPQDGRARSKQTGYNKSLCRCY